MAFYLLQYSRRQGKCLKFAYKGSSSNIQDSDSTDDELPGPMDSGSSTDDEVLFSSFPLTLCSSSSFRIYIQILILFVLLHSLVIKAQCQTLPTRRNNLLETCLMKQWKLPLWTRKVSHSVHPNYLGNQILSTFQTPHLESYIVI